MHFELSPLLVWIALWTVNTYSKFQVNILSNNRDITKCQIFYKTPAIMIPMVFSENNQVNKKEEEAKQVNIPFVFQSLSQVDQGKDDVNEAKR